MRASLLNFSHSLEAKQINNIHHKNHSFRGCAAPHTCSMLFLLMPVGVFSRHIEGVWHLLSTDTNAMFINPRHVIASMKKNGFHARMLDAVGQAVIATDPLGKVIYWNRAAESLYGWSAEESMGLHSGDHTL